LARLAFARPPFDNEPLQGEDAQHNHNGTEDGIMAKPMKLTVKIIIAFAFQGAVFVSAAHAQPPTSFQPRPIPMGVSISTTPSEPFIFAGTAGMRVRSLFFPQLKFILSNNHVMGAVAPSLCPNTAPPFTWILQPGTLDIGFDPGQDPTFLVGLLVGAVPIDFSPGAINLVDAAIAFTSPNLASTTILDIGDPTPQLGVASPGMALIKSGRTSGVTTGTVQSVNATVLVSYGPGCGTARFIGQVITSAGLGESGDSGSVVLDSDTLTPVGLFFAGSPVNGVMNEIFWVYVSLGVFVDSSSPAVTSRRQLHEQSRALQVDARIEKLKTIQARHEAQIMRIRGVVGIGIGLAENGQDMALVVYCEKITDQLISEVPKSIEGVPVRLVESGRFEAY
jgi:hypothetical protein